MFILPLSSALPFAASHESLKLSVSHSSLWVLYDENSARLRAADADALLINTNFFRFRLLMFREFVTRRSDLIRPSTLSRQSFVSPPACRSERSSESVSVDGEKGVKLLLITKWLLLSNYKYKFKIFSLGRFAGARADLGDFDLHNKGGWQPSSAKKPLHNYATLKLNQASSSPPDIPRRIHSSPTQKRLRRFSCLMSFN